MTTQTALSCIIIFKHLWLSPIIRSISLALILCSLVMTYYWLIKCSSCLFPFFLSFLKISFVATFFEFYYFFQHPSSWSNTFNWLLALLAKRSSRMLFLDLWLKPPTKGLVQGLEVTASIAFIEGLFETIL